MTQANSDSACIHGKLAIRRCGRFASPYCECVLNNLDNRFCEFNNILNHRSANETSNPRLNLIIMNQYFLMELKHKKFNRHILKNEYAKLNLL